jgi:hypothetical protein
MPSSPLPQKPATQTPSNVRSNPQVRIMLVMTLLFVSGIVLYSVLPEGAVRGTAVTLITVLTLLVLFKGV